jgi:RNA polymerase sigma factor (sigma-70 family)
MEIDVLKYKQTIQKLISWMKIPKDQREDMEQECYLHLLTALKGDEREPYVFQTCKNVIREKQRGGKTRIRLESMSDPQTAKKASQVRIPELDSISEEQLYEGIYALPLEESRVIYNLFVDGKTQEETAADLGLTRERVRTIQKRAIKTLKKYFEVDT